MYSPILFVKAPSPHTAHKLIGTLTTNLSRSCFQKLSRKIPRLGISWGVPLPSNSHQQEKITFFVGNPSKLHWPLLLGRGTTQGISS